VNGSACRERAAVRDDERGITVIELLVTMLIVALLSTIVVGAYQSTTQALGAANSLNRNTAQAANGMNEASREIRAATDNLLPGNTSDPAVVEAANESVLIYAYINLQSSSAQLPVMVRLRVDPTTRRLVEDIWSGTQSSSGYWTFPSTATTPRTTVILASTVATQTGSAPYIFTYLAGTTVLPVPAVGVFTAAQRGSITSIKISLTVQNSLTNASRPVTLQNTVGMPNLSKDG
jgi:Tfp pilus assembly protein PilE